MDVHCSTCEEPWDADYLRYEAIYETGLSYQAARAWRKLPPQEKLSGNLREQFAAAGWAFGASLLNVRHCPACPPDARLNRETDEIKAALTDLFGEDEDGLAATFEDYGL